MGWWSEDVMGGDQALDNLPDYEKIAGLRGYDVGEGEADETIYPISALSDYVKGELLKAFNKDPMAWLKIAEDECDMEDRSISAQVGAVIALSVGGNMTDEYKEKVISYIAVDEWATRDKERKAVIDNLMETVRNYKKGFPVVITSKGLFEKMNEVLGST